VTTVKEAVMPDRLDETERFSLGTILTKLRLVSTHQLAEVLEIQRSMTGDERLGEILIARGMIGRDQLEIALAAQIELRSPCRTTRALAAARLSEATGARVLEFAGELRRSSDELRRRTDGAFRAVEAEEG
jgi:hypothetical protein